MNGAITMPAGDPAALEQLATQLETAAQGSESLGDSTGDVTAQVRSAAQWTGNAADAYTAFTGNLAHGATGTGPPLGQIAGAVREYAVALRAAQQKVTAYSVAVKGATTAGNDPAALAAVGIAGQDAAGAITAQQMAGDRAAAQVLAASEQLTDPFGPDGPVRAWIERVHAPWDSLAGDAALGRFLASAAGGREDEELAEEFAEDLPELMSGKFNELVRPWMTALSDGQATEAELAAALRQFTSDYDVIGELNTAWKDGGEAAQEFARPLDGLVATSDVLALAGDYYTLRDPEDSGTMGWVDRGVAGANAAAAGVDTGYAAAGLIVGSTIEIPVAGEAVLVGTGLYLGADYLYHHWTPFHDVTNDVGHAVATTAKDTWRDVTSFF